MKIVVMDNFSDVIDYLNAKWTGLTMSKKLQ
jgi:hypothetical protein